METTTLGFINRGDSHHNHLREFFQEKPALKEIEHEFFTAPELHGVVMHFNLFTANVLEQEGHNDGLLLKMFESIGTTGEAPMPESQDDNFETMMQSLEIDESKAKAFLLLDANYHVKHFALAVTNIIDDEVKLKMLLDSDIPDMFKNAGLAEIMKPRNRHPESPSFNSEDEKREYFADVIKRVTKDRPKSEGKNKITSTDPVLS